MTDKLAKEIIQWDVKAWSPILNYWDETVDWSNVQNCLELGGREGGLSLFLALKGKTVICSDLHHVEQTAKHLHCNHSVSHLISYQNIDAANIPYENYFDVIIFKSIIGGIGYNNNYEIQKKVFSEIYKALKPGGKLLFAENLIASPFHQLLRKKFVNWGSSWRYISIDELIVFLKDFSSNEIKTTGLLGTFGRTEKQRNILSTLDLLIFNKLSPTHWKYISYGIAVK